MSTRWESASSIPNSLIEDYEKATLGDIIESYTSGGQTIHTTSTSSSEHSDSPNPKKARKGSNDDTESR